MKNWKLLLPLIAVTLTSCKITMPATFWTEFDVQDQREKAEDQGPSGGIRAIHWQAEGADTFAVDKVLEYARLYGWTLIDSTRYTAGEMSAWEYDNHPVFPLTYDGFHPSGKPGDEIYKYFPRWFTTDALVLRFETGWVSVTPGTEDRNEVNGFVLVNKDRNEMAVYHLWGEWENE